MGCRCDVTPSCIIACVRRGLAQNASSSSKRHFPPPEAVLIQRPSVKPSLHASRSDAFGRGDITVLGGEFTGCRARGNGAFMFVSDGAVATITGGTVSNCIAQRRAGVVSDQSNVELFSGKNGRDVTIG